MTNDLPKPLESLVAELSSSCGMVIEEKRASESFGNGLVDLLGNDLLVRIVRDRSQWHVCFAGLNRPDKWYDLDLVRQLFGLEPSDSWIPVDEQAQFVRENWQGLASMFGAEHFSESEQHLDRLAENRARRRFPRWTLKHEEES